MICPVCSTENSPDAIFCANEECGKALGGLRYAREEFDADTRWHQAVADRIAAFIGAPHFLVVHGLWFVLWVVLNTLVLTVAARFDAYPFGLLGIILSVEAIFITGVLMISQNRQSAFADKRAELDYEISVLTHRKLHEIERMLKEVQ